MEDDYESLPTECTMNQHMFAGACAGIMEHSVMYPVDCVKTRLMCLKPTAPQYNGLMDGLYQLVRQEGIRGSVRGIGAVVGGAGPAHALYFACYEECKSRMVNPNSSHLVNQCGYALSGAISTLLHDAIMTPADAVKQRVQLFNSPYRNSCQCLSSVVRNQGLSTLYRAYTTQLTMNIPQQSVHFMVYELMQHLVNPTHEYRPMGHVISGGLAGAVSAFIVTPLDVCKTVLNTQDECAAVMCKASKDATTCPRTGALIQQQLASTSSNASKTGGTATTARPVVGMFGAATFIWQSHGLAGFFRGWQARVLFQMPGTAISWSVYEYFKWYLRTHATRQTNSNEKDSSLGSFVLSVRSDSTTK